MANEKRLIDPKKAMYIAEYSGIYDFDLFALETLLDEHCVSVDAVEVVRCGDCESYHFGRCWNGAVSTLGANRRVSDFCS